MRILSSFATLVAIVMSQGAFAQDQPLELTPAGKAILHSNLASDGQRAVPDDQLVTFPLAMCTFPGGLCGAVHRDGTVAGPPLDTIGSAHSRRAGPPFASAVSTASSTKTGARSSVTVSHRRRLQIRLRAGRRGWQVRLDRSRRQDGRRAEVRLHRGDRSRSLPWCFGRTAARRTIGGETFSGVRITPSGTSRRVRIWFVFGPDYPRHRSRRSIEPPCC